MAFENPFLKPSSVRESALAYLWSDSPQDMPMESGSVVNDVFKVSDSVPIAQNVLGNIVANSGEYNPDDSTDYSSYTQNNPVEAWKAYDQYGTKVLSQLGRMGVPFTSAIGSALEQSFANNYNDLIGNLVNQYGGETMGKTSPGMAALARLGVSTIPIVGNFIDTKSEDFKTMKSLRDQFGTTDATTGYFSAALDPTISQIAQGMFEDPTSVTPAQFGTVGSEIQNKIYNNVASGMDLNAAQAAAIDYFNPPAAVTVPVATPALPTPTPLNPIGSGLLTESNVPESVINEANQSADPIGSLINQLSPPPPPVAPETGSGVSGNTSSGGGVTDSFGNAVTDSSGNQIGTRDYNDSGSSSGGGKIVCTAMNEHYGFGSFRNRIWLNYAAKHLTKEHEKGYHALFLPLVDLAYRKQTIVSKPLRAVLENIARHRSADLRAEMRNSKRDTVGRIYRAILEPLCYIVGKYK